MSQAMNTAILIMQQVNTRQGQVLQCDRQKLHASSTKLGITYALTDATNIYSSVAFANQAPTTSELTDNEALDKTKSINYEIGLKTRTGDFSYDMAIYQNRCHR